MPAVGQGFEYDSAFPASFSITPSVPSGTTLRLTVADPAFKISDAKSLRMVMTKALATWIAANAADLATDSPATLTIGQEDADNTFMPGDGFPGMVMSVESKYVQIVLAAITVVDVATVFNAVGPYLYAH